MAFRRHTTRLDAQALTPTPSGGLRVERARLARIGLQRYRTADGEIVEYRSPEEVFSPESLARYQDAAVTIWRHPDEDVTADNWKAIAHGHVAGPAVRDGDWVVAAVVISSAEAVQAVRRGDLLELSCGYDTDLLFKPGDYQGQRYDALQTNIRINHLTLLPPGRARAGRGARLVTDGVELERVRRLDAKGDEIVDELDEHTEAGERKMPKHRFHRDSMTFEVEGDEAAGQALGLLESDLTSARKDAEDQKKRADTAESELKTAKEELAKAKDPKTVRDSVTARVKLLDDAEALGAKRDELVELETDREVMLKALGSTFKADEKTTDGNVLGAFKYAVGQAKAKDGKKKDEKRADGRDHLDDAAESIFSTVTNTDGGSDREAELTKLLDELDEREEAHAARVTGRKSGTEEA